MFTATGSCAGNAICNHSLHCNSDQGVETMARVVLSAQNTQVRTHNLNFIICHNLSSKLIFSVFMVDHFSFHASQQHWNYFHLHGLCVPIA